MGPCKACIEKPVMRCGRCTLTRCAMHAIRPGERCQLCERDWADEAPTRRAAKLIFAPPAALLAGGLLFGLLLPVSIGGAIGATVMAMLAAGTGVGAGAGACKIVDRSARAMFLRERAGSLPTARLLPSGRNH
ncbi:MAG TPA: hypothetical protein VM513_24130 [Kofleriaceae bacterium]|jgi:hypothetical protein|nr:hypothetical protein [Kofleriaceae bacterium]